MIILNQRTSLVYRFMMYLTVELNRGKIILFNADKVAKKEIENAFQNKA